MEIRFRNTYQNTNFNPVKQNNISYTNKLNNDCFVSSNADETKDISFGKSLFDILLNRIEKPDTSMELPENQNASQFAKALSTGIKTVFGEDIQPKDLKSIMTPEEFRELLPKIKQENFTYPNKNSDNKYNIDLDFQSNFSQGSDNLYSILNKAAAYADKHHEETGEDFIFALTDRDTVEGVQHAIRIIGENPEKFKHLKFIPAVKISYAHKAPKSQLNFENSDLLVYGINPFSVNISNFLDNTISKRKNMILEFIKDICDLYPEFAYDIVEFAKQNDLNYKRDYTVSNLYWRAREYAETKGAAEIKGGTKVADTVINEANQIINNLKTIYVGSQSSAENQKGSNLIKNEAVNIKIREVFDKYATHLDNSRGEVVSSAENLFDNIIDCLSLEKSQPTIALSAPYYLSHHFEDDNAKEFPNVVAFIQELKESSHGMLQAIETVAPSYFLDNDLWGEGNIKEDDHTKKKAEREKKVHDFNKYILENDETLYQVGGSFAKLRV